MAKVSDSQPCITRAIGWAKGTMIAQSARIALDLDVFLSLSWPTAPGGKVLASIDFKAEPITRQFSDPERSLSPVHMFRLKKASGDAFFAMFCASCGHFVTCAESELSEIAALPCRECATPVSGDDCHRWHNWGACLDCPGSDPVRSGPANKAGPAANQPKHADGKRLVDAVGSSAE